jgi:hypothetical protein
MLESPEPVLDLRWSHGTDFAHLTVDLDSLEHRLAYSRDGATVELSLTAACELARSARV